MKTTATEMENSYVFLVDMKSKQMYDDEIKVDMEAENILVISYKYQKVGPLQFYMRRKKFELPQDADLDSISAVSLNGTLMVSVNKLIKPPRTTRSIKVTKADQKEADGFTDSLNGTIIASVTNPDISPRNLAIISLENPGRKITITITEAEVLDARTGANLISNVRDLLAQTDDCDSAIDFYFSYLCQAIPSYEDRIKTVLTNEGFEVITQDWKASPYKAELEADAPHVLHSRDVIVVLGQLLIILFKNINSENYDDYISRRTIDMCARMGMSETDDKYDIGVPMKGNVAVELRQALNGMRGFKSLIIHIIMESELSNQPEHNSMLSYVGDVLSWTDMLPFNLIRIQLLRTRSPLFYEDCLKGEWENFYRSLDALSSCRYPKFFSILADVQEVNVMQMDNFPMIAAIALASAQCLETTNGLFEGFSKQEEETVNRLFQIHRSSVDITKQSVSNKRKRSPADDKN